MRGLGKGWRGQVLVLARLPLEGYRWDWGGQRTQLGSLAPESILLLSVLYYGRIFEYMCG